MQECSKRHPPRTHRHGVEMRNHPVQRSRLISHDVALFCDNYGIMIRSGFHCAQPLHQVFKLQSSARASFYIYNTREEIDRFVEVLKEIEQALMSTVDDYVARIDGACGAEKDVIVTFKYEKKDEAIATILKRAELKQINRGNHPRANLQGPHVPRLLQRESHLPKHQKQSRTQRDTRCAFTVALSRFLFI